jgi:hypothetical protein
MNTRSFVTYALLGVLCQVVPGFSQEAILPQGDPRLRDSDEERAEVREDPNGLRRQDTGIADPSVNPGQASGMRIVRGEVKQATLKTIVVEDSNGKEATMLIDAATAGDRDIRPGDVITGTVTAQGRAVAIHKEQGAER